MEHPVAEAQPPHLSYARLFLRFLRFGLLAWGGPVAQIAMLRQELVDEERWITSQRFNRTLAIYQVLPGPEAHELCVYFGMLARGRLGGVLAGLGFMLPGLLLMLALSWFYLSVGVGLPLFQAVFHGFQAAVIALIIRAVHRIGAHALTTRWLAGLAAMAFVAELLSVHFALILLACGSSSLFIGRGWRLAALGPAVALAAVVLFLPAGGAEHSAAPQLNAAATAGTVAPAPLLASGLRAGLLTFGGAYTAIPFLEHDAVGGGWMSRGQFLDGVALSGILPAPLIIFSTFVGYYAGGLVGALAMTLGIFLPAFCFTLIGHSYLERLIEHRGIHSLLDGVTAGVVGLIAATALQLLRAGVDDLGSALIFALALITLYLWKSRSAVAVVVLGSGLLGLLIFQAQ